MQGKRVKRKWIKLQKKKNYNHGQSLGILAFLGHFPVHTGPTPPLTPQTMLDACILNFFRVSTLYIVYGWGKGELNKSFKKDDCFNEGIKK